ncbi:MAG: ABC transporter substrate-binding protein [Patescibacteria group bacterium]
MRKLYWYFSAYVRKHGLVFVSSLVIALLTFWFFVPTLAQNLEVNRRYYIAVIGDYTLADLPPVIKHQLSVGLTELQEDGSAIPALSERWTTEQDNATFRFLIQDDLSWQDGEQVTPSSIQYQFDDLETIYTPNDIVFNLPAPYAPFPTLVSEPILKSGTKDRLLFFSEPTLIGIGEYSITGYERIGQQLKELRIDGDGDRYIYRFYLTEQDAVLAYKKGEVDIIPDLSRRYDIFDWSSTIAEEVQLQNSYLAIFFNNSDPNLTRNIRQGLSYALEKKNDGSRAIGPISPKSWAYLPGGKTYNLDIARGSERMRAELPRNPLTFTLTTTSLFQQKAEQIKQEWEAFGEQIAQDCQDDSDVTEKELCDNLLISINIRVRNFPDTQNFQMLLVGQEIPADPDQYSTWHSEQATNFTNYNNTRIDTLLERGRQTLNQQDRTEIYQEFQQFFLEDPPAVFLEYLPRYSVRRNSVTEPEIDFYHSI